MRQGGDAGTFSHHLAVLETTPGGVTGIRFEANSFTLANGRVRRPRGLAHFATVGA